MTTDAMEAKVEDLGMIALICLLLVPGVIWVAKGGTGGAKTRRGAILTALMLSFLLLETKLDRSAETMVHAIDGEGV